MISDQRRRTRHLNRLLETAARGLTPGVIADLKFAYAQGGPGSRGKITKRLMIIGAPVPVINQVRNRPPEYTPRALKG